MITITDKRLSKFEKLNEKKYLYQLAFIKKENPLKVIKIFSHSKIKQIELSGGKYMSQKILTN